DTPPLRLTRLDGRRRVDCPVTDGVMNHVDARTQLVATITAHRVWTATVEPLIRRHVTDVLSLKLDFAGQNRAASHAPRKHGPASDRMVFCDFELAAVELIGSPRPHEARRGQT